MAKKCLVVFVLSLLVLAFVFGSVWPREKELLKEKVFSAYRGDEYVSEYLLRPPTDYGLARAPTSPYTAVVGTTFYDFWHNNTTPKMMVNDYQGSTNGQHVIWTYWSKANALSRYVKYNYRDPDSAWTGWRPPAGIVVDGGAQNAGFPAVDVYTDNSKEVVFYHTSGRYPGDPDGTRRNTMVAIESGLEPGTGNWKIFDVPDSSDCHSTAEGGMWPHPAIDSCGNMHFLVQEAVLTAGFNPITYTRCTQVHPDTIECVAPGIAPVKIPVGERLDPAYNLSALLDTSGVLAYLAVASPRSKKVALVWAKQMDTNVVQIGNEIFYIESDNCGDDWITSGFPTPTNVTRWKKEGHYKTYCNISAVYDQDDSLHIVWDAMHVFSTDDGETWWYNDADCALMHWSKATEQFCGPDTFYYNTITAGIWEADPGAFAANYSKPSLGVGVLPENDNYLYCVWVQFDSVDKSAYDLSNGELFVSVSKTGGRSWDTPQNITNSHTEGCDPAGADDCAADNYPSLGAQVDSFLHILYLNDLCAGANIRDDEPGVQTPSPVLYYQYPIWPVTADPRVDWEPKGLMEFPWIHVPNDGSVTETLLVKSIGTATVTGALSNDSTWLTLSDYSYTILEGGCPEIVELTIDVSGYFETFLVDTIHITSNDTSQPDVYVGVHVLVSDEYYPPDWVASTNETFILNESNVGNLGHQIDTAGMYLIAEEWKAIFDGSVALATASSPARVGRFIYDDELYMLAETSYVEKEAAGIMLKVVKSKFSPLNPVPPIYDWWWTTVEMYDKIFYSGAPDSAERFIKKVHLKIYRNPKPVWWPPETGSNPEMFAGMVIDFDMPYDSASQNIPGYDTTGNLNLLYMQGQGAENELKYAGIAFVEFDEMANRVPAYAGHSCMHHAYVYPKGGWVDDSLYRVMSTPGWAIYDTSGEVVGPPDSTDYSCVITGKQIPAEYLDADTVELQFLIVISSTGLEDLKDRVKMFVCGNADRDREGAINFADVISMADEVLGGSSRTFGFLADINGDCALDFADVVDLASYCLGGDVTLTCTCEEGWP